MTTSGTSFFAATSDPLMDAMRQANLIGLARLGELTGTGFDTNNLFDPEFLTAQTAARRPYLLTSLQTSTVYLVFNHEQVGDMFRVLVQVYQEGEVNERFWRMELVRAGNGSIRVNTS